MPPPGRSAAAIRTWTWPEWLGVGLLSAAIVSCGILAVRVVSGMLGMDWNGARLAPAFSLVYGYRLYYPAGEGPILNHVYGPAAALAFLPATVFRSPTQAILAGAVLQVCFIFGPLLAFIWRASGHAANRQLRLACALGAFLIMVRYEGTVTWISMLHVDGPALALGLLACAALSTHDGAPPMRRALVWSALAAVLSAWAKQTDAPLPFALALAVWLMHGRAVAWRYVAMLAAIGSVVSAVFLLWFGEPMLFNMVEVVSRHPWRQPGIGGLAAATWHFLRHMWEVLALLAAGLGVAFVARDARRPRARAPWISALLAAVFLLPTGALGANKFGGDLASFHSAYYLLAAAASVLADSGRRAWPARALGWALCAFGVLAAGQIGWRPPFSARAPGWHNNNQLAYEFALRHPGEAYFPWQPLASLLAEGRLYHFEYGLLDRFLAGYEPGPTHLRAHLPPRLRWIAAPTPTLMLRFFPEYSVQTPLAELPGWEIRTRPVP